MNDLNICQSCGMPMETDVMKGTEKDGSKSEMYCSYCYKDGAFEQDISMEEMIEINLKYIDEWNKENNQKFTVAEAREQLKEFMPSLKRWQ